MIVNWTDHGARGPNWIGRRCRDCGEPLPQNAAPNKLYCALCAARRKDKSLKMANRKYMRRYRAKKGSQSG